MKIRCSIVGMLVLWGIVLVALSSCGSAHSPSEQKKSMESIADNDPQKIKELITRMKEELEKDEDRFPELIKEIEAVIARKEEGPDKAILYSMAAEMYSQYLRNNQWTISQRTSLSGYTPEDIREWSENLFAEKIKDYSTLSLQPAELLQQTPVALYDSILIKGDAPTEWKPTLYDLLAQRAVEIHPSEAIFAEWVAFHKEKNDPKAVVSIELKRLAYNFNPAELSSLDAYRQGLEELLTKYGQYDFSNNIRIALASMLTYYQYTEGPTEAIQTTIYQLLKEGIRLYPDYEGTAMLRNQLLQMEAPFIDTRFPKTVYPGKEIEFPLTYKNVKEVTLRVYESVQNITDFVDYATPKKQENGKLLKEIKYTLASPNTYSKQDTTLTVTAGDTGLYEYVLTAQGDGLKNEHTVGVTRLMAVSRQGKQRDILVTDLESGKPVNQANITLYGGKRRNMSVLGKLITDKNGLATVPGNKTKDLLAFHATLPGDTAGRLATLYPEYDEDPGDPSTIQISLFTDRGLYRPGQNVYFKGIVYQTTKEPKIIPNKTYTAILRDANNKEIATQKVKTNAFGSFNGELTLPKQGLNGHFTLSVANYSAYFRVEEYKRPSFSAEIEPINEDIAFGDEVTIKGFAKTFSGVSLQDGKVTWRIVRRPFLLRQYYGSMSQEQVAKGSTNLSNDGSFSLSFRPERVGSIRSLFQYYYYDVMATVTDSKGESQETQFTFPVGNTSMVLTIEALSMLKKETAKVTISAQSLKGEKRDVTGNFRIVGLQAKDERAKETEYTETALVASGTFTSDMPISTEVFNKLASGRYRLHVETKDSKGREIKGQQDFILYGKDDSRPPVFSPVWTIESQTACLPGETAEWVFGTSFDNTYVLYEVYQNNRLLQREQLLLNNENRNFKLPFKESYGDGVIVSFTFIKEGELYVTHIPVKRRQPDRKLTIRPETFRDRLLPGSQESWKFRITDADSLLVSAEMLAAMYDYSLDKIVPFKWYFLPERGIYLQSPRFYKGDGYGYSYQHSAPRPDMESIKSYTYDQLDWQGVMSSRRFYNSNRPLPTRAAGTKMRMNASAAVEAMEVSDDMAYETLAEPVVTGAVLQSYDQLETVSAEEQNRSIPAAQLRTNFNETAFFYPTLYTNKQGDVMINFTLPESTTTWKLQMIAHTKELKYGMTTHQVISSKPLMVVPNLPRYLRQGDKVTISTQVVSQHEESVTGKVRLEWFDPATDRILPLGNSRPIEFRLAAGEQTAVKWEITVPSGNELLGCRIIAEADAGSDGEQHVLPVLSNQIMVTESTPFYLMNKKEEQIRIERQPNSSPYRLTLEMSANPVWYAVQALPTLNQPSSDNVISWFASYYVNTLAGAIVNDHPRIRQVITQWAAQGGDASTLISNLEKNEELKNILLEETPWVLEAENETERKQRLSLLFDINRSNNLRETAMRQLIDQQKEDGGWGWFRGFYPDRNITISILTGMHQLIQLGAVQYNQEEKEMQMRALRYLDLSMLKDYQNIKKHSKDGEATLPTPIQISYLYMRSAYRDIPEVGEAREAIRFFTHQAEKNWEKLSLQGKGETALLMHRNGKKDVAANILAWLRKTATVSEEQGMYWANNRRNSDFFTSPIDVHTLLMSAFHELSPDKEETDRMKQWLLNQKRTQDWESAPATMNAIHSILLTGTDWLSTDNKVSVEWAGKTFRPEEGEIATGYLKQVVTQEQITPEAYTVTVRKEGTAPAWGAIYNQYYTSLDKVNAQKGVLNVEKKLFVERNNGKEREIRPVSANARLKVGDKVIVRLTIRTDRDMDYVFLKDLRCGAFEPARQLSGATYQDGIWYYQSPKDISENFYIGHLPKGTFVIEYPAYVSRSGEYAGGISTIQCLYAPEFVSHTEGERIRIDN